MEALQSQRYSGQGAYRIGRHGHVDGSGRINRRIDYPGVTPRDQSESWKRPGLGDRNGGLGNIKMMMQYMMQLLETMMSLFKEMGGTLGTPTTPSDIPGASQPPDSGTSVPSGEDSSPVDSSSGSSNPSGSDAVDSGGDVDATPTDTAPADEMPSQNNGGVCGTADQKPSRPGSCRNLSAQVNEKGQVEVKTKDGYTITCEGKDQAWIITSPSGRSTRIWGDPHVNESDGDTWDFTNQSSFRFGRNKITVEVTPYGETGATLSRSITIYNGNDRLTISGIDENKPFISATAADAREHDAGLDDGDIYRLGRERNGEDQWRRVKE